MESGESPITDERGRSLEVGIKGPGASTCVVQCRHSNRDLHIDPRISAVTSVEGQYTFTSSKQEGAMLVPGGIIATADAKESTRYAKYIVANSASWLEFANETHHRNLRLIDLVLVTGWHKTESWACAAFSQCSHEISLTFNVGVGTTQGGVWGKWSDTISPGVERHSGPVRASLKDGQPSSPQSNKCPMNVGNLGFHWLLAYSYDLIMPGLHDLNR